MPNQLSCPNCGTVNPEPIIHPEQILECPNCGTTYGPPKDDPAQFRIRALQSLIAQQAEEIERQKSTIANLNFSLTMTSQRLADALSTMEEHIGPTNPDQMEDLDPHTEEPSSDGGVDE